LYNPAGISAGLPAQAIVSEMKTNPDFQGDFAGTKGEIAAARTAKILN